MHKLMRNLTSIIFFLVTVTLVIAYTLSSNCLFPPWYRQRTPEQGRYPAPKGSVKYDLLRGYVNDPKTDWDKEYYNITFDSTQNGEKIIIRGWHVPNKRDTGVVFVHGGGGDLRDFLRQLPVYYNQGFPLLFFDCNAMGISGGKPLGISFGYRESVDTLNAVKYAREVLGWKKVILVGASVGGATVLLTASRKNSGVDLVISENPFTSMFDMWHFAINKTLQGGKFGRFKSESYGVLTQIAFNFAQYVPEWFKILIGRIAYLRIAGFDDPTDYEAINVVDKISPIPIFLIHSKEDDMIPYEHSLQIFEKAKEPKELWIKEKGAHSQLYDENQEIYFEKITNFIKKYLK